MLKKNDSWIEPPGFFGLRTPFMIGGSIDWYRTATRDSAGAVEGSVLYRRRQHTRSLKWPTVGSLRGAMHDRVVHLSIRGYNDRLSAHIVRTFGQRSVRKSCLHIPFESKDFTNWRAATDISVATGDCPGDRPPVSALPRWHEYGLNDIIIFLTKFQEHFRKT